MVTIQTINLTLTTTYFTYSLFTNFVWFSQESQTTSLNNINDWSFNREGSFLWGRNQLFVRTLEEFQESDPAEFLYIFYVGFRLGNRFSIFIPMTFRLRLAARVILPLKNARTEFWKSLQITHLCAPSKLASHVVETYAVISKDRRRGKLLSGAGTTPYAEWFLGVI